MENLNETSLNSKNCYIPYDSQLLLLKNSSDERNKCLIEEIYHPSITGDFYLSNRFGIWEKNKELEIYDRDIHKRRHDLNRITFVGLVCLLIYIAVRNKNDFEIC